MKSYVNYIDAIAPPEELERRLRELRRPFPVYRAAALAAVLALAVGVGVWASRPESELGPAIPGGEIEIVSPGDGAPDIAIVSPGSGAPDPAPGGYDIVDGRGPGGAVTHYVLPELSFADGEDLEQSDYSLGEFNEYTRDVTALDVIKTFGGMWREHLGLDGEEAAEGTLFFTDSAEANGMWFFLDCDGDPQIDMDIEIEVLRGFDVPSCFVLPDDAYGHTDVEGIDVTSVDCGDYCVINLFVDGFGYKATIRCENYRELAARFVSLVIHESHGLNQVMYEYPTEPLTEPEEPDAFTLPQEPYPQEP